VDEAVTIVVGAVGALALGAPARAHRAQLNAAGAPLLHAHGAAAVGDASSCLLVEAASPVARPLAGAIGVLDVLLRVAESGQEREGPHIAPKGQAGARRIAGPNCL
jgi:hypothetical protein